MAEPDYKLIAKASIAAITSVAGAFWLFRTPEPAPAVSVPEPAAPSAAEAPRRPAAPEPQAAAGSPASCQFEEGNRVSYSIHLHGSAPVPGHVLNALSGGGPSSIEQDTRLMLDLEVLTATSVDDGAVLLGRYRNVESSLLSRPDALDAPFMIRVAESCDLTGFARLDETAKADARTQQAILHELSWRWPQGGAEEGDAQNGTGAYLARYTGDPASGTAVRQVLSYETFWDEVHGGLQRLEPVPSESKLTVTVGSGPWFETLQGREVLSGERGATSSELTAVRYDAPLDALDGVSADPKRYVWENLLPGQFTSREPSVANRLDLDAQEKVAHLSPSEVLERLDERVASGTSVPEAWPELKHYLEARPEHTQTIVEKYQRGDVSQEASNVFYIALGQTRTSEAKSALLSIMRDEAAPIPERVLATFNLLDRADVDVQLAQQLGGYSGHLANRHHKGKRLFAREATLAAGALAGLHPEDAQIQAEVAGIIRKARVASEDPIVVRPTFGAIGNTGDPKLLPIADEAFRSTDPRMRAAAALAILRMHPKHTSDMVARWLARETDGNVKRAIYTNVRDQTTTTPEPVSKALIAEAVEDLAENPGNITRRAILHVLGRATKVSEQARQALIAQIAIELDKKNGGMYATIAEYLDPADVAEGVRNAE